ncbi:MAG: M20/M25/M40 family metallo-hydrolase [Halobacteria archaeon]
MNEIDFLEDAVRLQSHRDVDEIREFLLERIDCAEVHTSGCIVAEKEGEEYVPTGSGTGSADSRNSGSGEDEETGSTDGGNNVSGKNEEPGTGDGGYDGMYVGKHVYLNTHMDVVEPHIPFEREGDIIKGRGSCDAKASLAMMASAFNHVDPRAGKVTLVVSPDEETESRGAYDYTREIDAGDDAGEDRFAVVGEPTRLDVCPAAKGRFQIGVEFEGEAAHAASGSGKNAVSCAAEAVRRLEGMAKISDSLLGDSMLTVTRFRGSGGAANRVPDSASITIDRRSVPPETQEEFVEKLERELDSLDCSYNLNYGGRDTPFLGAFRTPENSYVVEKLREVSGGQVKPFPAATEASYFADYMPVAVFGPGKIEDDDGKPVVHSPREYIDIHEVSEARRILEGFLDETVG